MMLSLESHSPTAECRFCKQVTRVADLVGTEVVTRKELNQRKEWMESSQTQNKNNKVQKSIIFEECPECDSK